jgi:hypothetical protein
VIEYQKLVPELSRRENKADLGVNKTKEKSRYKSPLIKARIYVNKHNTLSLRAF